ncbi:Uncharacterised protein [Acinetobacter baumannii]|uniref:hypothetical protein n=1 Tax=Acinetobacter baumannii TaxID=470 RepID=UPI000DE6DA1A|nr:hypothetical protein [Acinetobacter baumannii]SSP24621.1 Uncharacterised protein [Acinetobacter baumannii]
MGLYTIRYGYRNNSFFIASNTAGQFIVIDALGADFQIGHQISYEGMNRTGFVGESIF